MELEATYTCDVCSGKYHMSQGLHEGHKLDLYGGVFACDSCWKSNWDGWSPLREPRLIQICNQKKISIPLRNDKGWLPRN